MSKLPLEVHGYETKLQLFENMVDAFRKSKTLPSFLSLVLAFGNYLNGGKKNDGRLMGQANGFHIDMFGSGEGGELDKLKDFQGKNLRQLLFKTYIEQDP